jgi:hypothetical protein
VSAVKSWDFLLKLDVAAMERLTKLLEGNAELMRDEYQLADLVSSQLGHCRLTVPCFPNHTHRCIVRGQTQ